MSQLSLISSLPPSLKMAVLLHSSEVYIMILAKELLGVCVTTLREREQQQEEKERETLLKKEESRREKESRA